MNGGVAVSATAPYLDGVYLAVNAIPDAYLIHDAHDCGQHKAEKIAANHDMFSDLLRWERLGRVVRTELDTKEYIGGSDDKLSKKVLQVAYRYHPALLVLARSNIVAAMGGGNPAVVDDLRRKTGIPIVEIPTHRLARDWVTGYLDTVQSICALLPQAPPEPSTAWVAGLAFDRHEGDAHGNAIELRRMLAGAGVRCGAVLLDGSPFESLKAAAAPSAVLSLPGAEACGAVLSARIGARNVATSMPVGLRGTAAWVRSVAKELGDAQRAEAWLDEELGELAPKLQWIVARLFMGRPTMLFADRLMLGPLAAFAEELGCDVVGVGCLSGIEKGQWTHQELGLQEGRHAMMPLEVGGLREAVASATRGGVVPLVFGSSFVGQVCRGLRIAHVELGYPSNSYHALSSRPVLGCAGVRTLIERAVNAVLRAEPGEGRMAGE